MNVGPILGAAGRRSLMKAAAGASGFSGPPAGSTSHQSHRRRRSHQRQPITRCSI